MPLNLITQSNFWFDLSFRTLYNHVSPYNTWEICILWRQYLFNNKVTDSLITGNLISWCSFNFQYLDIVTKQGRQWGRNSVGKFLARKRDGTALFHRPARVARARRQMRPTSSAALSPRVDFPGSINNLCPCHNSLGLTDWWALLARD